MLFKNKKSIKYKYKFGGENNNLDNENFVTLSNSFLDKDENKQFTDNQQKQIKNIVNDEMINNIIRIRTDINNLKYSQIVMKKYLDKILPEFDKNLLDTELSQMKKYAANIIKFDKIMNYRLLKKRKTYLKIKE